MPSQNEIAEKLKTFIFEKETEIRRIGFYGCDMSLASLKWHMVTMILFSAYSEVVEKFIYTKPVTAFGDHAYIWGE